MPEGVLNNYEAHLHYIDLNELARSAIIPAVRVPVGGVSSLVGWRGASAWMVTFSLVNKQEHGHRMSQLLVASYQPWPSAERVVHEYQNSLPSKRAE
jgi:hypothetical protein